MLTPMPAMSGFASLIVLQVMLLSRMKCIDDDVAK